MTQQINNLQKCRQLYNEAQNDINKNRLNRFNEDRMKKRYIFIDKQITNKQNSYQKKDIQQLKFYRNKFNSLVVLVNQSVKSSYSKSKFQTEVRTILKENWNNAKDKIQKIAVNQQNQIKKVRNVPNNSNKQIVNMKKQIVNVKKTQRSKSPLQKFFQQNQNNSKNVNFMSILPKNKAQDSQILQQIKKMPIKQIKKVKNVHDSRIKDLKIQNEELQKIVKNKQTKVEICNKAPNTTIQQLQKEVYYFEKVNEQLRQNNFQWSNKNQGQSPYQIQYQCNNVSQIQYRNLQYSSSRIADQRLKKTQNRNRSKSPINKRIFQDDNKSDHSSITQNSSKVQRQKQVYINSTPQVLFENQLIKVMVIRNPIKIQQKISSSFHESQNPQDLNPNQEKLQLIILNNTGDIVKPQQLFIKTQYMYDSNLHKVSALKIPNKVYYKKIINSKNIVFCQMIRIKLLDKQGYNQQIKVNIKSNFFYNSDTQKKRNRMAQIIQKKQNQSQIQIKLPLTFIQFSNKPFSYNEYSFKKQKLTIIPNKLYDTFQHTFMNTKLPIKKALIPQKIYKQSTIFYARSYIHKNGSSLSQNGKNQGTYLQSQIELSWSQKKDVRYLSIITIQQWVYLVSYMFMDIQQEEEEFQIEFRKPSMHVFFNMEDNKFV